LLQPLLRLSAMSQWLQQVLGRVYRKIAETSD
jgi:hypothetical protein